MLDYLFLVALLVVPLLISFVTNRKTKEKQPTSIQLTKNPQPTNVNASNSLQNQQLQQTKINANPLENKLLPSTTNISTSKPEIQHSNGNLHSKSNGLLTNGISKNGSKSTIISTTTTPRQKSFRQSIEVHNQNQVDSDLLKSTKRSLQFGEETPSKKHLNLTAGNEFLKLGEYEKQHVPASVRDKKIILSKSEKEKVFSEKTFLLLEQSLDLFLDNNFDASEAVVKEYSDVSVYSAVGNSLIWFIRAAMTFEKEDISHALDVLTHSMTMCDKFRKRTGLVQTWWQGHKVYEDFTQDQLHAELVSAEAILLKAVLTFFRDESFSAMIKGGLDVRSSYNVYQRIYQFYQKEPEKFDPHFVSGVKLGVGCFNLFTSLLPPRILKLVEFIGFSGNRQLGLDLLEEGARTSGIRSVFCSLCLLLYHAMLGPTMQFDDLNLDLAELITDAYLRKYPNAIVFLFYRGRIYHHNGFAAKAITMYNKALSIKFDGMWERLHHVCYWESMWSHTALLNWKEAGEAAAVLQNGSGWSKAIYTYLHAVYLFMQTGATQETDDLFTTVPTMKQRIAGRSIPLEKFVMRKSRKYFMQNRWLFLPSFEVLFVWCGFRPLRKKAKASLLIVEEAMQQLAPGKNVYYYDDLCMGYLFQAVLLHELNRDGDAEQVFQKLFAIEGKIVLDQWVAPFAHYEYAKMMILQKKYAEAHTHLKAVQKNYSHYSNESRLAFRVHHELQQPQLINM